ncbi:MAG: radical SAM protein [Clostridia bacterium]|nr:radical SAM protein [Clostridia bacterium]
MKQLSMLLKPASGLCNMRCSYCFYADVAAHRETRSYGVMTPETARAILQSAAKDLTAGDELTVAFQGGEPTLAGIDFFRSFFADAEELLPGVRLRYAFQTNGLLLDAAWCELFLRYDVLVGVSIDGSAPLHNGCRTDAAGKGTYARVLRSAEMLQKAGVPFNVLTVLTNELARHPAVVWKWIEAEGFSHVQFIPCLDALDAADPSPYALTPARFLSFYRGLFPLWQAAMQKGRYISVKLFDDLVNLYLRREATACGITGRCAVQFIVEANGDAFPCDFYVLDAYRMGSLARETPSALLQKGAPFLRAGREYADRPPCLGCRYRSTCGGGCKRLKDAMCFENGVCRYAELLDEILLPLLETTRAFLAQNR